jgi:hypothetical protein
MRVQYYCARPIEINWINRLASRGVVIVRGVDGCPRMATARR